MCRALLFSTTFRGNVEDGFFRILAANSPELADDVRRARLVGRLRGFAGVPGHFRQAHGPGWMLVGDAGYFKDPLTAHGITDALRDAELLVRAFLDGKLDAFQAQRDALSRQLFDVTDAITSFRWDLDEVKTLHTQLSASMRAEGDHIAQLSKPKTVGRIGVSSMTTTDSLWKRTVAGQPSWAPRRSAAARRPCATWRCSPK